MDKRVIKTKSALRNALFDLLEFESLNKISIVKLCKTAKINRRTFYIHYDKISDIFEEYQYEIYETVVNNLSHSNNTPQSLIETVDRILKSNFIGFRQLCLNNVHYQLVQKLEDLLLASLNDSFNIPNNEYKNLVNVYISSGLIKSYIIWFKSEGKISEELLNKTNKKIFSQLIDIYYI